MVTEPQALKIETAPNPVQLERDRERDRKKDKKKEKKEKTGEEDKKKRKKEAGTGERERDRGGNTVRNNEVQRERTMPGMEWVSEKRREKEHKMYEGGKNPKKI